MSTLELLLIAVALSMDAFAVSICKGLTLKSFSLKHGLVVGLWFGSFQALMPAAGYLIGSVFGSYIETVDHWIAFGLLAVIGLNMVKESFEEERESSASLSLLVMLPLAVATSIDALAVGVTFGLLPAVNIMYAVSMIGLITCGLSVVGVKIGHAFGGRHSEKAERVGGVILILIGVKILVEHLGLLQL